ncbi:MAG: hypothetical protein ACI81P_001576 [Neolewinella sp.]|jgi:hypothetical protein
MVLKSGCILPDTIPTNGSNQPTSRMVAPFFENKVGFITARQSVSVCYNVPQSLPGERSRGPGSALCAVPEDLPHHHTEVSLNLREHIGFRRNSCS